MSRQLPLNESQSATVPASGAVTVQLGPARPGESWDVTSTAINCTGSTTTPTAVLSSTMNPRLDATRRGDTNTSDVAYRLQTMHRVSVAWAGASSGAVCTVTVTGIRTVNP